MVASAVKHADDCECRSCTRRRNEPTKARCACCYKTRLCKQRSIYEDGPHTYDPHYCVSECFDLTQKQRKTKRENIAREKRRNRKPPLAFPIIGGPLDGKYAVSEDFHTAYGDPMNEWYRPEGRYSEHGREYAEFNSSGGGHRKIGGSPTMVFIHRSLLKPLIRGIDR